MPIIFRQRDIDKMQASDVSQEFVDYFNRLSESRQEEFAENRPDLYLAVSSWKNPAENELADETEEEITVEIPADEDSNAVETLDDDEKDIEWQSIQQNVYKNVDIPKLLNSGKQPIVALTTGDTEKCPAHRTYLKKYTPKYYKQNGAVMGVNFYYCKECNGIFISRSEYENNEKNMREWGIPHTFYGYDISRRYLKTQMKPYELNAQETIYWVDPWIENNPICPIHECVLEEVPCVVKYKQKSVSFDACYCEQCKKVVLRKTRASSLEDELAQAGIPSDRFEQLVRKNPERKPIPKRRVKPDYYLNEGRKSKYTFDQIDNCYYLTEEDTVVVSDAIYCSLDGHDTQTVLGVIGVKPRNGGRRQSYMVMLGYCAECNKYYMDEADYKTIYKAGRPEVKIIVNLDDNSYMITSGEVFNIEQDNLKSMETKIDREVHDIQTHPDYVSQYATVSYNDDFDLYYKKERSRRSFEPRLEKLASYKPRPYEYFVEISADGKKEKYYVGSSDITLFGKQEVIAVGSRLGRSLVNYRTITVNKDGEEYRISLSRQFDINNETLFGYTNLRTDEDVVFRKGITDPFLVRILNMRRKQHDLTDIFVTIQENQNTIVDADFGTNLVVQGCAGSGKTMVLLHRLSSLKYNESDFDFANDALILTPNDHFTLHINGLAESLQIDSIRRISVERYYAEALERFSGELSSTSQITSEMNVQQNFVDYIYSDDFRSTFERNYDEVIKARNLLIPLVYDAAESLGVEINEIDISDDSSVIPQLERAMNALTARININENELAKAADELDQIQKRKKRLAIDIQKSSEQASKELREAGLRVKGDALGVLAERKKSVDAETVNLSKLKSERDRLIRRTESANDKESISFDRFIAENNDLIEETQSQLIRTISDKRADLAENEEEKKRVTELLNVPFEEFITLSNVDDPELAAVLAELSSARDVLKQLRQEKTRAENGWVFGRARRVSGIEERINETENLINTYETSILELLTNRRIELETISELIEQLRMEISADSETVVDMILDIAKQRIETLNTQIDKMSKSIDTANSELNGYADMVYQLSDDMDDTAILAWFDQVSLILPAAGDSLMPYQRIAAENKRYQTAFDGIDSSIEEAQAYYDKKLEGRYPNEIKNTVNDLKEEIAQYTAINTSQMVFDRTVQPFMISSRIRSISGRNHRYDLYARLVFALKYYEKTPVKTKYICIDEGQDLALNEYRLIRELNGNDVVLNIFGDTNQLIKPNRGITDWDKLKCLFAFDQYVLNENYRNTNQITRFCNESFSMSMLQTGVDDAKVREITRDEFERELNELQIGKERVAVLLPRTIQKKTYVNQLTIDNEVKEAMREEISKEIIAVMYVDEVKGIEFDKVYVIPSKMTRNEKYIAYTRALTELILVIEELEFSYKQHSL